MLNTLKTKQIEYDKSSFLIDLIENERGVKYIQIVQVITVEGNNDKRQVIKFNNQLLYDMIHTLQSFQEDLPMYLPESKRLKAPHNLDVKELIKRYCNGIKIEDLVVQFSVSKEVIEQVLRNNDIEIANSDIPYYLKRGKNRNQRR